MNQAEKTTQTVGSRDLAIRRLAEAMADRQDEMIQALAGLCAIPSISSEPVAGAPYGEATVQALRYFLDLGESMGFRAVNLDNRCGYLEYGDGDRMIAMLAHLDVVPAGDGWTGNPFALDVRSDRLVARGALDDKGPAIAALFALRAIRERAGRLPCRIRLIVGLDEEKGSSCMAHYVQSGAELPDAGFTPDASFPVIYAEKGLAWLRCTWANTVADDAPPLRLLSARAGTQPNVVPNLCSVVLETADGRQDLSYTGVSTHASTPELGQNAINQAASDLAARFAAAGGGHPFVSWLNEIAGPATDGSPAGISSTDESGSLTWNNGRLKLDADQAELIVDIRYPVTANFPELVERLRAVSKPYGVQIEVAKHTNPLYIAKNSPLIMTLTGVYNRLLGEDAEPVAIGGGTYARTMPNIVAFGPGFPGVQGSAHQADECILTDHFLAISEIYRQALIELANTFG